MICSEFVYRSYDEALPDAWDRYSLRLAEGDLEAFGRAVRGPSAGQGIHPESLLGQAARHPERLAAAPVLERAAEAPPIDVERALEEYLREVQEPVAELERSPAALVADPQLAAALADFAAALYQAEGPARGPALESTEAPAALQNLVRTAADFVTPGDLLKTQSLHSLGRLQA